MNRLAPAPSLNPSGHLPSRSESHTIGRRAFTLIELLVVIAIIAILAALLLPSLSKSRQSALSAACINNLRQLQVAYLTYVTDFGDRLPPNHYLYVITEPDHPAAVGSSWCPGNVLFDTTTSNIQAGVLYPYTRSTAVYRCPADPSKVFTTNGTPQALPRTRSYNLSIWLNCDWIPDTSVTLADVARRSTSEVFAFIDTHEDCIADPTFGIYRETDSDIGQQWIDMPANRHRQGANLSFMDGHVEHWRWKAPKACDTWGEDVRGSLDLADLRRLQRALPPPRAF